MHFIERWRSAIIEAKHITEERRQELRPKIDFWHNVFNAFLMIISMLLLILGSFSNLIVVKMIIGVIVLILINCIVPVKKRGA